LKFLRRLIIRPWFVRIVHGSPEKWEDVRGIPKDLSSAAFSKSDEKISIFKINNPLEEARVIAAYQIPRRHGLPPVNWSRYNESLKMAEEAKEARRWSNESVIIPSR